MKGLLFTFLILTFSLTSYAVPKLPEVPGVGGGGGGGKADLSDLADQQSAVVQSLNTSLRGLSSAQVAFAEALGLKEVAAVAKQNSENLASGDLAGKDDLKKAVSSSKEIQDKINKKMEENIALTAESKLEFSKGVPPYVEGSIAGLLTARNAQKAAKSLKGNKDLTVLKKMASLIYVVSEAPKLISLFSSSTTTLNKFMNSNEMDTSELTSVSDAMGD